MSQITVSSMESKKLVLKHVTMHAALVICGLGIRGFDYLRTRKQGSTVNNEVISTVYPNFKPKI